MSLIEEILSEIVTLQRELLTTLTIEEKNLMDKQPSYPPTFQSSIIEIGKKIRHHKLKLKKLLDGNKEEESVEHTTLKEQYESLDKKIKDIVKSNKKLRMKNPMLELFPEEKEEQKRRLLLEEDTR